MVEVDHDRRRLRLGGAELGLLVALAGGAGERLGLRPEAVAPDGRADPRRLRV